MRSRYTAYVIGNAEYLRQTWAPEARPPQLELDVKQKWLGLKVKRVEGGSAEDDSGIVEFVARYKIDGRGHRLHETSEFRKDSGHWLYVSGSIT